MFVSRSSIVMQMMAAGSTIAWRAAAPFWFRISALWNLRCVWLLWLLKRFLSPWTEVHAACSVVTCWILLFLFSHQANWHLQQRWNGKPRGSHGADGSKLGQPKPGPKALLARLSQSESWWAGQSHVQQRWEKEPLSSLHHSTRLLLEPSSM